MDPHSAREDVRLLLTWQPISVEGRVVEGAWHILDHYQLSYWDALIVSAAQLIDCRYLLTDDLQENQKIGHVEVINPFNSPPESI